MDLLKIIKERRSIRRFMDKPISDDIIDRLLESIQWAPSWANTQCWEIILVKNNGQKESLQKCLGKGNPASKGLLEAPVVFAFCAKRAVSGFYKGEVTTNKGDWYMFDIGLSVQNFCITAYALGLGTVIVGLFDADEAEKVLSIPSGYSIVAIVPTGYPARETKAPPRKDVKDFLHHEKF